jgi:hypothetical protein
MQVSARRCGPRRSRPPVYGISLHALHVAARLRDSIELVSAFSISFQLSNPRIIGVETSFPLIRHLTLRENKKYD